MSGFELSSSKTWTCCHEMLVQTFMSPSGCYLLSNTLVYDQIYYNTNILTMDNITAYDAKGAKTRVPLSSRGHFSSLFCVMVFTILLRSHHFHRSDFLSFLVESHR